MPLCTQVEAELQDLEAAEAQEYLQSLGVQEGGLRSLIAATYKQLGLLTYFTTGVQLSSGGLVRNRSKRPAEALCILCHYLTPYATYIGMDGTCYA